MRFFEAALEPAAASDSSTRLATRLALASSHALAKGLFDKSVRLEEGGEVSKIERAGAVDDWVDAAKGGSMDVAVGAVDPFDAEKIELVEELNEVEE